MHMWLFFPKWNMQRVQRVQRMRKQMIDAAVAAREAGFAAVVDSRDTPPAPHIAGAQKTVPWWRLLFGRAFRRSGEASLIEVAVEPSR